jgi:hypothetical protein
MLRISLFGPPNRRKQPERYTTWGLKLLGKYIEYKLLTKEYEHYKIIETWRNINEVQ